MPAEMEPATSRPLTERQCRFVEEYLRDRNAAAAAVRAGYSRGRAAREGYRLRNIPRVRRAIEEVAAAGERQARVTREQVVAELARVAFADISDFLCWDGEGLHLRPMEELTAEQTACVSEIVETGGSRGKGLRVKLHGKLAALAALARLLGVAEERQDRDRRVVVVTTVPEPDPPPEEARPPQADRAPAREQLPAPGARLS